MTSKPPLADGRAMGFPIIPADVRCARQEFYGPTPRHLSADDGA